MTAVAPEARKAALAQAVANALAGGGTRVETQSDYSAVLVTGQPVNHTLHLILTLVTCGLWGIVWIVVAVTQKERRSMVTVDEYGNVSTQQLS